MERTKTYRDFKKLWKQCKKTKDVLHLLSTIKEDMFSYKYNSWKRIERISKKILNFHEMIKENLDETPCFIHKTDKKYVTFLERKFVTNYNLHQNDVIQYQFSSDEISYEKKLTDTYYRGGYAWDCYDHIITISRKHFYENKDNIVVDDMLLLKKEETQFKNLYKCKFLKPLYKHSRTQGSYVSDFRTKECYWYHSSKFSIIVNARNAKNAMTVVKKKKRQQAKTKLVERLMKRDLREFDLSNVIVTKSDSINAGNCKQGTENFMERHGLIHGIDAESLLELEDSLNTRRAILYALQKTLLKTVK